MRNSDKLGRRRISVDIIRALVKAIFELIENCNGRKTGSWFRKLIGRWNKIDENKFVQNVWRSDECGCLDQ